MMRHSAIGQSDVPAVATIVDSTDSPKKLPAAAIAVGALQCLIEMVTLPVVDRDGGGCHGGVDQQDAKFPRGKGNPHGAHGDRKSDDQ